MPDHLAIENFSTPMQQLDLGGAQVFHIPDWGVMPHPKRLEIIRQLATMRGRDPRIAKLAHSIISRASKPREFKRQAAALLTWVQHPLNFYYVNEAGERLQDPIYTLEVAHSGDCDDAVALLCAFFESIRLPWKLVLSGKNEAGDKVRYIEGMVVPEGVTWGHIYCMVGAPPFTPKVWWFCEPTIQGVPLGWDVIDGPKSYLPRLSERYANPVRLQGPPRMAWGRPAPLPPAGRRSPAYAEAYGGQARDNEGEGQNGGNGGQNGSTTQFVAPVVGAATALAPVPAGSWQSRWSYHAEHILVGVITGVLVFTLAGGILVPIVQRKMREAGY